MSSKNVSKEQQQLEEKKLHEVPLVGRFWAWAYALTHIVWIILFVAYVILFFPMLLDKFKWVVSIALTVFFGVWPSVMLQLLKVEGVISNWDLTNLQYYIMVSVAATTFIRWFCKHAAGCFFIMPPFQYLGNEMNILLFGLDDSDKDSDEDSDDESSDEEE